MNLLYIVSKKGFDLTLGRYLQNYCNVFFVTNHPTDPLFFRSNNQHPVDALSQAPRYPKLAPDWIDHLQWQKTLEEVECYRLAQDPIEKKRIKDFFLSYLGFLLTVFEKNRIDVCLCHERDFLDTACAQLAAKILNCPIYYLSTGFFRGQTLSVAPERIRFTDCEIWEKRISQKLDPPAMLQDLPMSRLSDQSVSTPSAISLWLARLGLILNPEKKRYFSYLRPQRPFLNKLIHKYKKHKICSYKQNPKPIREPFILVPLQGNEVLNLVPNPLGIVSMEHLFQVIVEATELLNRDKGTHFNVVLKEHPFRPFVISEDFAQRHPKAVFFRKYDMAKLLEKTSMVVTFNSLAGFEALQNKKPVVMLGPLFYRLKGLVHWPESLEDLSGIMWQALNTPIDAQKLDRLIRYLKIRYEVKANRKNLTDQGMYHIARKVLARNEQ